jgi:hypothetical protein
MAQCDSPWIYFEDECGKSDVNMMTPRAGGAIFKVGRRMDCEFLLTVA